jgi:hypothetical protein
VPRIFIHVHFIDIDDYPRGLYFYDLAFSTDVLYVLPSFFLFLFVSDNFIPDNESQTDNSIISYILGAYM